SSHTRLLGICARLLIWLSKANAGGARVLYPCPAMTWARKIALGAAFAALLSSSHSDGAKPRRRRPTPTPTPAYTPTPTPVPLLRAAGSCLRYEKDHFLVLAEVGTAGRVFHIDKSTVIAAKIST